MRIPLVTLFLFLSGSLALSQDATTYEVYAIRFDGPGYSPVSSIAVGATSKDSVKGCNMFWYLKSSMGNNILVDAGFLREDSTKKDPTYLRPDLALARLNVRADDISDIIITHPHFDHIDGISLFPNAIIWMQKDDYGYFVGEAWQKDGNPAGFRKEDVRKIVERNLQGKLILVKGDSLEIMPGIRVFIGSRHTWESQYLLVASQTDPVLLASDGIWFYYNLDHMLPIPKYTFDPTAYVRAMKRMTTLVPDPGLIIPGHDGTVFDRFPKVGEGIVRIR